MTLFPNKVSLTDLGGPGMNMPFWGDTVLPAQMMTPLGECVGAQEGYPKTIYQLQRGRTLGKDPASPRVPPHVARAATQPPRTVLPNKRALAIRPCCRKLGRGYGPTRKHLAGSDHLLNKPSPSWIVLDSQTSHRQDRVCPSPHPPPCWHLTPPGHPCASALMGPQRLFGCHLPLVSPVCPRTHVMTGCLGL